MNTLQKSKKQMKEFIIRSEFKLVHKHLYAIR